MFFGLFGKKKQAKGGLHDYGKKQSSTFAKGAKAVGENAGHLADIADSVGGVAGMVGNVAGMALPFTAAIPGVGEIVAGVAAGGKAIQYGAGMVSKAAHAADTAQAVADSGGAAIDALRRGDIIGAGSAGAEAIEDARDLRKQIQRKKKR